MGSVYQKKMNEENKTSDDRILSEMPEKVNFSQVKCVS